MHRHLYFLVVIAALNAGCKGDYARPNYDRTPKGPLATLTLPSASPELNKEKIAVVRRAEAIQTDKVLSVQGEVEGVTEEMLQTPVLVEIRGRGPNGEPTIVDSGFGKLDKKGDGLASYRFDVRVPQQPGEYEVEARLFEKWIGRAKIEVERRTP